MAASGKFAGAVISAFRQICNFVADFQHNVAVLSRGIAKNQAIVIIRNKKK